MYRALYEYKSALPDYLSFRAGDQFTIIDRASKDWFKAQNGMGQIGYVPCTYVTSVQVTRLLQAIVFFSLFVLLFWFDNNNSNNKTQHDNFILISKVLINVALIL